MMRSYALCCTFVLALIVLRAGDPHAGDDVADAGKQGTIEVQDGAGKTILVLKRAKGVCAIWSADGEPIANAEIKTDRVKVRDDAGKVICTIKSKRDGCKLYDSAGKEVVKIKRKGEGFGVRSPSEVTLVRMKAKDYGFRATDSTGAILCRVKLRVGKVVIRDKNDQTILQLKGDVSVREGSAFGIERLDLLQRAGLLIYFQTFEREREK